MRNVMCMSWVEYIANLQHWGTPLPYRPSFLNVYNLAEDPWRTGSCLQHWGTITSKSFQMTLKLSKDQVVCEVICKYNTIVQCICFKEWEKYNVVKYIHFTFVWMQPTPSLPCWLVILLLLCSPPSTIHHPKSSVQSNPRTSFCILSDSLTS